MRKTNETKPIFRVTHLFLTLIAIQHVIIVILLRRYIHYRPKKVLITKEQREKGFNDYKDLSFIKSRKNNTSFVEHLTKFINNQTVHEPQVYSSPERQNIYIPEYGYRVPSFLIIGAQKAGTTSLRFLLKQHPNISHEYYKELHFFSHPGFQIKRGFTPLMEHFSNLNVLDDFHLFSKNTMICDSTPLYLLISHLIPIIKHMSPWIKIIAILRNPVDRLYSHYAMTCLAYEENCPESIEKFIEKDLQHLYDLKVVQPIRQQVKSFNKTNDEAWLNYVLEKESIKDIIFGRGLYSLQLRQWFKYFPRSSMLILKYEDIFQEDSNEIMKHMTEFLGLPKYHKISSDTKHIPRKGNYSAVPKLSEKSRKYLHNLYRPYNRQLKSLLGPEWKDVWET